MCGAGASPSQICAGLQRPITPRLEWRTCDVPRSFFVSLQSSYRRESLKVTVTSAPPTTRKRSSFWRPLAFALRGTGRSMDRPRCLPTGPHGLRVRERGSGKRLILTDDERLLLKAILREGRAPQGWTRAESRRANASRVMPEDSVRSRRLGAVSSFRVHGRPGCSRTAWWYSGSGP
jgi:hypothetical protein